MMCFTKQSRIYTGLSYPSAVSNPSLVSNLAVPFVLPHITKHYTGTISN